MRIAHDVLARFTRVPEEPRELRELLDDLGLEVKRVEDDGVATVFTLELLANRGDHHCYEGVARELAARGRAAVCTPPVVELEVAEPGAADAAWEVRNETPLCLRYSATLLERGDQEGTLGPEDLRVLEAADIHSLGPAVDGTNLANLELGQPTHAFDADKVEGAVVIRTSRAGEAAWPLFREAPVTLPEGTLVIADERKILAVAGVIGCEDSKTTDATRRMLLESATFDPVAVRKASRALDIHTDSSARFERGADPERVLSGAGRVVGLLEGAGWRRVGRTTLVGDWQDPGHTIGVDTDALNAFLETRLPREEVADILRHLGFTVREDQGDPRVLAVVVPPRRVWDVSHAQDLYEEVAKIVGYNETPIGLPPVEMGALPSESEVRRARVDAVLNGLGFYEVFTDGFYGRHTLEQLGLDPSHPLWAHVETENALDRAYSLLKNNALAQAVEAVAVNLNRRNPDVKAYEWTRTFHPVEAAAPGERGHPPCEERRLLWLIASGDAWTRGWAGGGQPADVWFLKGLLRELSVELGVDLTVGAADGSQPLSSCLHPRRQATITLAGAVVGIFGEVHPAVLKRYRVKGARPVYLEIGAEALFTEGSRPAYVEPPIHQPIVRSLAFTLPYGFEAGDVAAWLHASGPDWLEAVDVVDLFEHTEGGAPVRTVTYALRYANTEAGRTADEVNAASESLIAAVQAQFGDRGVKLR